MLTKSKFRNYADCPNEFWLDHHYPEPSGELSLNDQLRREAGYEVEGLARTLLRFQNLNGFTVEFGTEFQTDHLYAKADIVVTEVATGKIQIYEVKSGTKPKDEYVLDLAFQCHVAAASGVEVAGAYLVILDNTYIFDGILETERLLKVEDVSDKVRELHSTLPAEIEMALAWLNGAEPEVTLKDYCKGSKLECRFLVRQFLNIPEYNVSNLFNAGSKKLNALLEQEILHIVDIPADFALTDREAAIVAVERSGNTFIDSATIRGEIDNLQYPLNFLDYETFNPAVPIFIRTRPYQQMVFQYSLHTIDEPGGEMRHSFHLSRNDGGHPTEEIGERLHQDLYGRVGTIIIWSEGFEKSRNTEIGEMYPQYAEFMAELNENVYDLRKVFSRRLYMDPAFRGRDSIKKVLPVITDLTYEGMDISDGLTASIKWFHAATGRGTAEERAKTFQDLEAYCHLDTLAMAEIYNHLLTV